jgi:hypothetical protein
MKRNVSYDAGVLTAVACLTVFVGCAGDLLPLGGSNDSGVDAGAALDAALDAGDAASDVAVDAGASRDPLVCPGGGSYPYDKQCQSDGQCAIATVLVYCCVSDALGINANDLNRFLDASAYCFDPATCLCGGNRVVADDGKVSTDPAHHDIGVTCDRGFCQTKIP